MGRRGAWEDLLLVALCMTLMLMAMAAGSHIH